MHAIDISEVFDRRKGIFRGMMTRLRKLCTSLQCSKKPFSELRKEQADATRIVLAHVMVPMDIPGVCARVQ